MNYHDPSDLCSETYDALKGARIIPPDKDGYQVWMTVFQNQTDKKLTTGRDWAINNFVGPGYMKPAQFTLFCSGNTDRNNNSFGSQLDCAKWKFGTGPDGQPEAYHPDIPQSKYGKAKT